MTGSAVLVGIVAFAAAGLGWYVYFYQKEKRLLQRLYDPNLPKKLYTYCL